MGIFNWALDLVSNHKIVAARLDAEFNYIGITQENNDATTQGELQFNEINVTSNTAVQAGSTQLPFADHVAAGLKITLTEGAAAAGFQIPLLVRLDHTVATNIWPAPGTGADHIALATQAYSSAADTAISGEGAGIYAASLALWLASGAVHRNAVAVNPEIISKTGSTILHRIGVRSQSMGDSGARGSDIDAAYTIVATTNSWKDGIVFAEPDEFDTTPPLHTSGSIMRSEMAMTVTDGINLSNVTFTGHTLNFPMLKAEAGGQVDITIANTSDNGCQVNNTNSGGVASFGVVSDTSKVGDFGIRCSARASYGALVANDTYVYGNGSTGVTIMADHATGVIKFTTGGNSEKARLTAAGSFTVGPATDAISASVTAASLVRVASFLSPSQSNDQKVYMTLGTANSNNNAFYWFYNHNSTTASRYLGIQAFEAGAGTVFNVLATGGISIGTISDPGSGGLLVNAQIYGPNIATTASAANAFIDTGTTPAGQLKRSTSSARYKRDIRDIGPDVASRILSQARPIEYRSTIETDRQDWTWYGLTAEDMAAIDPRLVHWGYLPEDFEPVTFTDPEGRKEPRGQRLRPGATLKPDGVAYDRLTVILIAALQAQEKRIAQLEARAAA